MTELRRVKVKPGGELAGLLAETTDMPLLLEKDGELFRLDRVYPEADMGRQAARARDLERARAALRASAGALRRVNRDELLADIHAQRGQDSSGRPGD